MRTHLFQNTCLLTAFPQGPHKRSLVSRARRGTGHKPGTPIRTVFRATHDSCVSSRFSGTYRYAPCTVVRHHPRCVAFIGRPPAHNNSRPMQSLVCPYVYALQMVLVRASSHASPKRATTVLRIFPKGIGDIYGIRTRSSDYPRKCDSVPTYRVLLNGR